MYKFITHTFRGAFVVVLTRGGWFAFGEVVDGVNAVGHDDVIGLSSIFGIVYVNTEAIDLVFV